MKILIIRHADPDYEADSLTSQGWKEAELLAGRISKMDIQKNICIAARQGEGYGRRFLKKDGTGG